MDLHDQVAYHKGTIEDIGGDRWLTLRSMKVPILGIDGYTYAHSSHMQGHAVAVLPYVDGEEATFLLRNEVVPPWGLEPIFCAITGAWDHEGEDFVQTAARELFEEAGFRVYPEALVPLGTCRGIKSSDDTFHLFAIGVAGLPRQTPPGDGSLLEQRATTVWCSLDDVARCKDPLVSVMVMRLIQTRGKGF